MASETSTVTSLGDLGLLVVCVKTIEKINDLTARRDTITLSKKKERAKLSKEMQTIRLRL